MSSDASEKSPDEDETRDLKDAGAGSRFDVRYWRGLLEAAAGDLGWLQELLRERFLPNLRHFMEQRTPLIWLLGVIIGVGVGYAALGFRMLIGAAQLPWLGTASENVYQAALHAPWYALLLAPVTGGLVVGWILHRFQPGRRAHAVADVIEARAIHDCKIDARTGLISALVSALSLGAGASAGREGPVVHLGATLASWVEDRFKLEPAARRTLLACGVGSAVSASFNAPIAGVLFAHEVILAHFAPSAFVPIVIASVAGAIISRLHLGDFPAFIIPEYQISSYWEFPAFALLGVTCALVSIVFQASIMTTERVAWRVKMPLWLRPAVGGLMVGTMAIWLPQVLGVGYDTTDMALHQSLPLTLLLALIVAKTAATAITLASRFGGGVFSPSLYLGAMTGGAFGIIAASAFPEIASSNGLYAILGMGAVASAILGAPISTTVIVFELTGGYDMTIALLLTASICNGLSNAVQGQSFFHWQLSTRGLFLQAGPHREIMRRLRVRDFMTPLAGDEVAPPLKDEEDQPWLLSSDTVESALRTYDRTGHHRIAVVHAEDTSHVIGWANHVDALHAFNQALIRAHVEGHR